MNCRLCSAGGQACNRALPCGASARRRRRARQPVPEGEFGLRRMAQQVSGLGILPALFPPWCASRPRSAVSFASRRCGQDARGPRMRLSIQMLPAIRGFSPGLQFLIYEELVLSRTDLPPAGQDRTQLGPVLIPADASCAQFPTFIHVSWAFAACRASKYSMRTVWVPCGIRTVM